ncbi:MAG: PilZ domain-containing protein [Nitrospirae bacterium]|nr:PilZ domain-containing protein [Nitrospirota bacterium]
MSDPAPSERRTQKRVPFIKEVDVADVGMRRCLDLSIGGMYLETVVSLPAGSSVHLRFKLEDTDEHPMEVEARVLYSQESIGVGLSFINLSKENQEKIRKFIDRG